VTIDLIRKLFNKLHYYCKANHALAMPPSKSSGFEFNLPADFMCKLPIMSRDDHRYTLVMV
jgi:hypothetical protein